MSSPDIPGLNPSQRHCGGAEAYISAFEDVLTSLEEVRDPYSDILKKMTFLNGIVDSSYSALHDILMEDDNKKYAE